MSDLHAWDWSHIDRETWADAHVPRPKTKSSDRLALPGLLVPMLQAWWEKGKKPRAGARLPVAKGQTRGPA
jgi:hypothetical protein